MLNTYKTEIQNELEKYFSGYSKGASYEKIIWHAMKYTPLLDGKRLRAAMALEIGQILQAKKEELMPLACAIEIMHAYSLIHDDLPCMDDDDMRRFKPSNHKVFGEAIALLAGDALISFGAQIIIDKTPHTIKKETILDVVRDYLICAGVKGIIAGQVADIEAEKKDNIDIENLRFIHKYKTAKLFEFSLVSACKIANADDFVIKKIEKYADNFGLLFQIYDDIIDCKLSSDELGKTAGKDEKTNKLTYVKAYGPDEAKNIFYSLINENCAILNSLNLKSSLFDEINNSLIEKVER